MSKPTGARGYTLVEMLVVLGVLALLVGLAWPSLRSPWGRTRLEDAGNRLRIALAKTRLRAIESGGAWVFRFEPGTGRFRASPLARPATDRSKEAEPIAEETLEGELPHDVRFVDPDEPLTGPEATPASEDDSALFAAREPRPSASRPPAARDEPLGPPAVASTTLGESDAWAGRIVFYPNGRSTKARLQLTGADHRAVEVTLRGLTGMARVGKPWRIEPLRAEPREGELPLPSSERTSTSESSP